MRSPNVDGAQPRPGVSMGELAAFESTHQLTLPPPVSQLYLTLDGLAGDVPDFGLHALQLWPLAELTRVSERVAAYRGIPDYGRIIHTLPKADQYLAFGDGMCWSHVLAVGFGSAPAHVLWICGDAYAEVASSFRQFWERYLTAADSVLWPTKGQIITPAV